MNYSVAEYVTVSLNGVLMAFMMVKKMLNLSQTVFVRSTNQAFKRTNTHAYTHSHTHKHTHGHTHTRIHLRMQYARMSCVAFRLKIRL